MKTGNLRVDSLLVGSIFPASFLLRHFFRQGPLVIKLSGSIEDVNSKAFMVVRCLCQRLSYCMAKRFHRWHQT